MDTKIPSTFWGEREIEAARSDLKLAALWLLTNNRVNLAGYAEVTAKRFSFETGLTPEALAEAFKTFPEAFKRDDDSYWIPSHIKRQIGSGDSLVKDNRTKSLLRAMKDYTSPSVVLEILRCYPELKMPFEALTSASPSGESRRTKQSIARQGIAKQGPDGGGPGGGPESGVPAEFREPARDRMLKIGALWERQPSVSWSAREVAAFRAAGLDLMRAEDFEEQLAPIAQYYRAELGEAKDLRRRDVAGLLENWSGEIDRARAFLRGKKGRGVPRL